MPVLVGVSGVVNGELGMSLENHLFTFYFMKNVPSLFWTLIVGTINAPLPSPTFFTFPSFLPIIQSQIQQKKHPNKFLIILKSKIKLKKIKAMMECRVWIASTCWISVKTATASRVGGVTRSCPYLLKFVFLVLL